MHPRSFLTSLPCLSSGYLASIPYQTILRYHTIQYNTCSIPYVTETDCQCTYRGGQSTLAFDCLFRARRRWSTVTMSPLRDALMAWLQPQLSRMRCATAPADIIYTWEVLNFCLGSSTNHTQGDRFVALEVVCCADMGCTHPALPHVTTF